MNRDDLKGKRVLVTGAGGFLGARIVRALLDLEMEVHVVLRRSTSTWRLDFLQQARRRHTCDLLETAALTDLMDELRPEWTFHAAGTGGHTRCADRGRILQDNLLASRSLIEAATAVGGTKIVHVGSSLEYGPRERPMAETDPPAPMTF